MSTVSNSISYKNYIMDPSSTIICQRQGGEYYDECTVLTYLESQSYQSEWVHLSDPDLTKERFCGFLFLESALKTAGLTHKILPAENKMAIHNNEIIYLSRYYGDDNVDNLETLSERQCLSKIGFTDTNGGANLRKKNGIVYVFDTEKLSFETPMHEKIDSFIPLHDAIRATLEKKLNE